MSLMITLSSQEQDRTSVCPGASDERAFHHARDNLMAAHTTPAINVTPPAIAALIECAAASFEVDRNASREYLFRAYALLRAQSQPTYDTKTAQTHGRLAMWQTKRVIDYIEANLGTDIQSKDLTDLVNLSTSHFFRAFKVSVGIPPFEFITRRRVDLAREMMRTTDAALAQIAVACGFSDQPHFCRVFRRIVGQSPNEWRRANAIVPRQLGRGDAGTAALASRGLRGACTDCRLRT
jgi:transcriptional regulator GlxA family with amidase domain